MQRSISRKKLFNSSIYIVPSVNTNMNNENKYYEKNRVEIIDSYKNKYKNDPVFREKVKKRARLWRLNNPKHYSDLLKNWRKENPIYGKEYSKQYNIENKDEISKQKKKYRSEHVEEEKQRKKKYYEENSLELKRKHSEYHKIKSREMRTQVLMHYSKGKMECNCCGEKIFEFLTIDHINGRKGEKRKLTGLALIRWLIKNNLPEGFQVLCWNCNCTKGFHGVCEHITPYDYNTIWHRRLKYKVLVGYSGDPPKCECCGESKAGFLTINHEIGKEAQGDKRLDRRKMFQKLIDNNFPKGYNIQCYNCNSGRELNEGKCPHITFK